ncbi:hypothetical protein YC2023_051336 [Brassica napus]
MALRKHQKQPENPIGILFYVPYLSAARLRVKTAEFGAEKLPSLFTALYGIWAFPKWSYGRRSSSRASRLMALRKHQKQPENPIGILFYVPYVSAARLRVKTAEFGPEKLASLFTSLYGFWLFRNGAMGDVVPHGSKVMRFPSLDSFEAEKKKKKMGCNTRTSREITHPCTTPAQARLTAEF